MRVLSSSIIIWFCIILPMQQQQSAKRLPHTAQDVNVNRKYIIIRRAFCLWGDKVCSEKQKRNQKENICFANLPCLTTLDPIFIYY